MKLYYFSKSRRTNPLKTKKKRSVWPVYAVALVWILFTLFHGLVTVKDYVLVVLASVIMYLLVHSFCPDKLVQVEEKPKPQQAQPAPQEDPEITALKKQRDMAISEMRRLNDNIKDETISRQIDHLEHTTGKIFAVILEKPEKKSQIRQFLDYYLPTTIKLLNAYDRADATGISGSNVNATKSKVSEMLTQIEGAFDRQLDSLFQAEAMDISADIQVMETLLAQEGLSDGKGAIHLEG
jgi:5-bromo-4-chloroindolyl phosphate hydrolysis protein